MMQSRVPGVGGYYSRAVLILFIPFCMQILVEGGFCSKKYGMQLKCPTVCNKVTNKT